MTPRRPDSFNFALDFIGDPEAAEMLTYVEELEATTVAPVALKDSFPGIEHCDDEGRCWFFLFPFEYSRMQWSLEDRTYGCNAGFTHWLPYSAIPTP